jgi:predicted enzyme related to lactoylglutathione lyase
MSPMVPSEVQAYWQIYFAVDDVAAAFAKAIELGAQEILAPQEFPGGHFAIVTDPQGASVGLMQMAG